MRHVQRDSQEKSKGRGYIYREKQVELEAAALQNISKIIYVY